MAEILTGIQRLAIVQRLTAMTVPVAMLKPGSHTTFPGMREGYIGGEYSLQSISRAILLAYDVYESCPTVFIRLSAICLNSAPAGVSGY